MSTHPTRRDYDGEGIDEAQVAGLSPYAVARAWVDDAVVRSSERDDVPEPLAIAVATVDADGAPDVRTVLMRFFDERGPGFVTALTSTKGRQLAADPRVAVTLTWPAMFRAIRFRGRADLVSREEVGEYFDSRPYGSRISAWTSRQSEPIRSRGDLEAAYAATLARFPDEDTVPVPDFWGGWRVIADRVEFWGGRRSRLHDRLVYTRIGDGHLGDVDAWALTRLQP